MQVGGRFAAHFFLARISLALAEPTRGVLGLVAAPRRPRVPHFAFPPHLTHCRQHLRRWCPRVWLKCPYPLSVPAQTARNSGRHDSPAVHGGAVPCQDAAHRTTTARAIAVVIEVVVVRGELQRPIYHLLPILLCQCFGAETLEVVLFQEERLRWFRALLGRAFILLLPRLCTVRGAI